jgi:voltage-gated potassium channel
MSESHVIMQSLIASRRKIAVFMVSVVAISVIVGCVMYLVEGPEHGFDSIPISIYWAIVTLTTVGYGDLSPITPLGKFFATSIMILGYGIIAVPTGIITAGIVQHTKSEVLDHVCNNCGNEKHSPTANYCCNCGEKLFDDA